MYFLVVDLLVQLLHGRRFEVRLRISLSGLEILLTSEEITLRLHHISFQNAHVSLLLVSGEVRGAALSRRLLSLKIVLLL